MMDHQDEGMSCEEGSPRAGDECARKEAILWSSLPSDLQTAEDVDMRATKMMLLRKENKHLAEDKRWIVVDWLAEVADDWNLRSETLHTGIALFDLYISRCEEEVQKRDIQRLGIMALNLAVKMHGDQVRDCIGTGQVPVETITYVTMNAYTAEEILLAEGDMITTLQWNLNPPIAPQFIDALAQIYDFGPDAEYITEHAMYLSEVTLLNAQLSSESKVAVGVCCMAISDVLFGKQVLRTVPRTCKDFWHHWAAAVRASADPPNLVNIGEHILYAWVFLEKSYTEQRQIKRIRERYTGNAACPGAADYFALPTKDQALLITESLSVIQELLQSASSESDLVAHKRRRRKGRGNRRRGNGRGRKWDTDP